MVAGIIISHQHKDGSAVLLVAEAVVMHGCVATTVSERQHRHLADLLGDLTHLVGLQVLDQKRVGTNQILFLSHGVVHTVLIALFARIEHHIHTDHPVWLNDMVGIYQRPADETVGTGNDIIGEALILQILEYVEHGFIDTLTIGHANESISRQGGIGLHILVELGQGHASISLGGSMGMLHVEMGRKGNALTHKIPDVKCRLAHILRCLVTIGRVIEGTVFEQVILKIGRIELGEEGAVHVEGGDAVFLLDEVGRLRVGHVLHIRL